MRRPDELSHVDDGLEASSGRTLGVQRSERGDESPRSVGDRATDDAVTRTAVEEREIQRRIEIYCRRVSGIESRFPGEQAVPADTSLFEELAKVES